jgi:hypothetical protein
MFLIERLAAASGSRPELSPQRFSYGSAALVRASLLTSQAAEPAPAPARHPAVQLAMPFAAARQRKAG